MQFSPVAGRTDLRFGASERDVVLSEYTSSGDFLGNFDPAAVVKKLPAGQSQTGGMLVRFQAAAVSQSTFRVPPSLD
jgi:hypothetical protein